MPNLYDDGRWIGGSMDRLALTSLMADMAVGVIDSEVAHRVDRLSRRLLNVTTRR